MWQRPQVIIIGAGFGGLYAARTLANQPVDVLLIDQQNFHTFTPLLYQVATCALDPSDIAYPTRTIFRGKDNVRFMLGQVVGIHTDEQLVEVQTNGHIQSLGYDYLIVAAGSVTNYFGKDDLRQHAFGLKDLSDGVILRNHILKLFERASWTEDAEEREALTTLVVVGGGPTGLETAGALYELYNHVLREEFGGQYPLTTQVILVEAADRLLLPYPERLQQAALHQLESLGVKVVLNEVVEQVIPEGIYLQSGQFIPTHTLVWAAGVKASPVAEMLGVALKRAGRVPVQATMEVEGRPQVYVVGDMAYLEAEDQRPYPMLIPVAKQQGILAARNILRRIKGQAQQPFHYHDRGIMATIGRSRAVAWIYYRVQLTGYVAWVAWLGLHLLWLLGFRNRISVFISWVWNYLTYDRGIRIILEHRRLQASTEELPPERIPEAANWR